jgi:hypothetical protein
MKWSATTIQSFEGIHCPAKALKNVDSHSMFALLFLAAVASTTYQLTHFPGAGLGRGFETVAVARNLAHSGSFANPFQTLDTGPTAIVPPLYPLFLAMLIRLFGDGPGFALATVTVTILVYALHAALLPVVSKLFFGTPAPGVCASILSILLPTFRVLPHLEALYVADGLMLFCLFSARLIRHWNTRLFGGVLIGLFGGFLLLLNPASLCVIIPWVLYLFIHRPAPFPSAVRWSAGFVVALFLTLMPWIIRNYRQLGAFVFIRDGLGLELHISNNDVAESSAAINRRENFSALHPNENVAEARLVKSLGEVPYFRLKMSQALRWIEDNPIRFRALTRRRIVEFWFPASVGVLCYVYVVWIITAGSFLGFALITAKKSPIALFIAAEWLIYPLTYYVVQSEIYYRYPTLWISLLSSGYFMWWLLRRMGFGSHQARLAGAPPSHRGEEL